MPQTYTETQVLRVVENVVTRLKTDVARDIADKVLEQIYPEIRRVVQNEFHSMSTGQAVRAAANKVRKQVENHLNLIVQQEIMK